MYNYKQAMKDDIRQAIDWVLDESELIERLRDKNQLFSDLYDDLWIDDSVTGNASGSYTFNAYTAGENLIGNFDLLRETCAEFGVSANELLERGEEYADVSIRCYLLGECLADVLDELEREYFNKIYADE